VLEIEKQYPEAGEKADAAAQPTPDRVNQIFHTVIMGGTNVALGSTGFTQTVHQVQAGNIGSLREHLAQYGVVKEDLDDLETAVGQDPKPKDPQRFGTRVAAWMGKMTTKAATGAWEVATSGAGELLAGAIRAYYGFGG
jgi:hypothetical protein